MATRHIAALAAVALAVISTPAGAQDIANYQGPGMKFYYSIPLDARSPKEQQPVFGMQMRGERPYEVVNFDNRLVNNFLAGGIGAGWIIAGVAAAGVTTAIAVNKKGSETQQQQKAAAASTPGGHPGHYDGDTCPNGCHAYSGYGFLIGR
jgi:hypothetical protein